MKSLANFLQHLFYAVRTPGQAGNVAATGILVAAGLSASEGRFSLFGHLEHFLHFMAVVIGSTVILNLILRHSNELLRVLIGLQKTTKTESSQTVGLIQVLLGFKTDDELSPSKNDDNTSDNINAS